MKEFQVMVDITMSKIVFVEANSESEARDIVNKEIEDNPFYNAGSAEHYVRHEICDCIEFEQE